MGFGKWEQNYMDYRSRQSSFSLIRQNLVIFWSSLIQFCSVLVVASLSILLLDPSTSLFLSTLSQMK